MTANPDGTAVCDRCAIDLPGFGVINGMVTDSINVDGASVAMIFCYVNACRDVVTNGLINYPQVDVPICTCDGSALSAWVPSEAMICADLDPADETQVRHLAFCYTDGCAQTLIDQIGTPA